jgi:hypothetical protein
VWYNGYPCVDLSLSGGRNQTDIGQIEHQGIRVDRAAEYLRGAR